MVYKLTYFDLTALGEPIRFMFKYGNIDFIDNRIQREDFPKIKDTMPFGQMPVLEFDGKKVHQSVAICRYLAKQVGLSGANDFENLEIDMVVDTINDFRLRIAGVNNENDQKIQDEKRKILNAEIIPFYLERLDKIAKENNGYLAAKKITWGDLYFVAVSDYMNSIAKMDLTANYVNLRKVLDNVKSIPNIKKWIETRPKTLV